MSVDAPKPASADMSTVLPLLWFADELGFLSINENLQAASGPPNIFAVGDVATSTVYPRPKAGVFAVRQGPPLTDNIRRYTLADSLC